MTILYALCIFLVIIYILLIITITYFWKHYPEFDSNVPKNEISMSIVVAFRNESTNLPALIHSIENQTYPREKFEVILADDHSHDGSAEFAYDYCNRHPGFRFSAAVPGDSGKKSALIRGVKMAAHEVVVVTDADCTMGEKWLETISGFHFRHKPAMIIGLVDIPAEKGAFGIFQEMEFLSLTGTGAGAAAMNRPVYCSGANLVYNRKLFQQFHDPVRKNIVSGDDTLFLHQVKKEKIWKILLLKSASAIVFTRGARSLSGFVQQRMRWASKGWYYKDFEILLMAFFVLIANLVILVSLVMLVYGRNYWLFPVLIISKAFADYIFLKGIMKFFNKKPAKVSFVIYELFYMVYVLLVSVLGLFFRFSWKGRKYY